MLMRTPVWISLAAVFTMESERRLRVPSSSSLPYLSMGLASGLDEMGESTLTGPRHYDEDRSCQGGGLRIWGSCLPSY